MFDRRLFQSLSEDNTPSVEKAPPVFPLPVFNGQQPVILIFDPPDRGIEIAYERHRTPDGPRVRPASRETTLFHIPRLTPVFNVSEGRIIYAREHSDGFAIIVEHRNGWVSYYNRLEHMFVTPSERRPRRETRVAAGDILGYVGPSRYGPLRPLRFELWRCSKELDFVPVDPLPYLGRWRVLRWNDAQARGAPAPTPHAA